MFVNVCLCLLMCVFLFSIFVLIALYVFLCGIMYGYVFLCVVM